MKSLFGLPVVVREDLPAYSVSFGAFGVPPAYLGLKNSGVSSTSANTSAIFQSVAKYRSSLMNHEADAISLVRDAYETAKTQIQTKLDSLVSEMEAEQRKGETITEGWLHTSTRYRELLRQVEEQLDLFASLAPDLATIQGNAVDSALLHAEKMAIAAIGTLPEEKAGAGVGLHWNAVPTHTIEAIVGRASNGSPLDKLLSAVSPEATAQVRNALAAGVAQGQNPRAIARTIQGVLGSTRARAEAIARTEVLQAVREATRQSYKANGSVVTAYARQCAEDNRTCPACWALSGQVYSTDEPMPIHTNCRCVMIAVTKSWAQLTGDDSLPDNRVKVKLGEDAFAERSEESQRAILGPSRFDMYSQGTPLSAMVEVYNDAEWGPCVRMKPVESLVNTGS